MSAFERIKNILKRVLPAPANSFHQRLDCVEDLLEKHSQEAHGMIQAHVYTKQELSAQIDRLARSEEHISALTEELSKRVGILEQYYSGLTVRAEVLPTIYNLEKTEEQITNQINALLPEIKAVKTVLNEQITVTIQQQTEKLIEEVKSVQLSCEKKSDLWLPNTNIEKQAWDVAGKQTAEYVMEHLSKCRVYKTPDALRDMAVSAALSGGLFLEFGVFSGATINRAAEKRPEQTFWGFDSFDGLPETWRTGFFEGEFAKKELPEVRDNVELVVGLFSETLPEFVENHSASCAYIHIDCDLYSSTKTVFDCLNHKIMTGTIIVFDEYFNYPSWKDNEFKAFQEFVADNAVRYEYIGYVPEYEQAAVRILGRDDRKE